ncbi:hypothetical protein BGAL_0042g00330 [Botrytis galanthina]|uniref:Uncharacterized protein n=1 Tax=Botrytis galanthina TaxID=278940 RepID=A0A4V4HVM1_9HELO|nr:hypothetical protein BGAL_0042g00330 [Botrytis galanthina]
MDYEKAETASFKYIVDTLNLRVSEDGQFGLPGSGLSKAVQDELADVEHADKSFGALFNAAPPSPEHETERNLIFLRVTIPFDLIPEEIDPKLHTADDLVVKLKFYANNMIDLSPSSFANEDCSDEDDPTTSDAIRLFTINEEGVEVLNGNNIEHLPHIVATTPGFDRPGKNGEPAAKYGIFRWELNVKEIETAISENLMHSATWKASPWAPRRVARFLQFIMLQHTFSLPIYIMDIKDRDFEYSLIKCLRGMRKELRDGNPFRAYLSQNFATNSNVPTIDSGSSIKDARSRPNIVTQKQLQHCTKKEMIIRLAVGTKQQLEDRRSKIVEFCALKQAIRLMKIVDDSAYYALFMAPQELRLQPGDILKVNFSPDNPIRNEDWNLTVSKSFDWSYQSDSVGICPPQLLRVNMSQYGANAKDQLDAMEYLRRTPVNEQRKTVAFVEGFPGVGKTAFLAHVVVCMLAQKPQAPIGCICAANQLTDVLAKAIDSAIKKTCKAQPDLAFVLQQQFVIRVYPTATETNFLISLADGAPKTSIVHVEGDDDHNDDGGVVFTVDPEANTTQQAQVPQEGTSQFLLETAELPLFHFNLLNDLAKRQRLNQCCFQSRCFETITVNTQQLNTGDRKAPVICKASDVARKARVYVNISNSMDARHSNLLLHRHVHAAGGVRMPRDYGWS